MSDSIQAEIDRVLKASGLVEQLSRREQKLRRPHWSKTVTGLNQFEILLRDDFPLRLPLSAESSAVTVGQRADLTPETFAVLRHLAESLIPWRKGPFHLCGLEIDAEWQSNLKWDRLAPHLPDLRGRRVLDVGCGNGYYMFRLTALNPALVWGIDPEERFALQFRLVQLLIRESRLRFDLLGVEHLAVPALAGMFDVLLCLGVIYHRRDPLGMLSHLHHVCAPGGWVFVESMGIAGDEPTVLCPPGRYAKARNVHFIPTAPTLCHWMEKSGFRDVICLSSEPTTPQEQRRTAWMRFESLADFLDPADADKTVEGYPAPYRILVRGRKL